MDDEAARERRRRAFAAALSATVGKPEQEIPTTSQGEDVAQAPPPAPSMPAPTMPIHDAGAARRRAAFSAALGSTEGPEAAAVFDATPVSTMSADPEENTIRMLVANGVSPTMAKVMVKTGNYARLADNAAMGIPSYALKALQWLDVPRASIMNIIRHMYQSASGQEKMYGNVLEAALSPVTESGYSEAAMTSDAIREIAPGFAKDHPIITEGLGFAGDVVADPFVVASKFGKLTPQGLQKALAAAGSNPLGDGALADRLRSGRLFQGQKMNELLGDVARVPVVMGPALPDVSKVSSEAAAAGDKALIQTLSPYSWAKGTGAFKPPLHKDTAVGSIVDAIAGPNKWTKQGITGEGLYKAGEDLGELLGKDTGTAGRLYRAFNRTTGDPIADDVIRDTERMREVETGRGREMLAKFNETHWNVKQAQSGLSPEDFAREVAKCENNAYRASPGANKAAAELVDGGIAPLYKELREIEARALEDAKLDVRSPILWDETLTYFKHLLTEKGREFEELFKEAVRGFAKKYGDRPDSFMMRATEGRTVLELDAVLSRVANNRAKQAWKKLHGNLDGFVVPFPKNTGFFVLDPMAGLEARVAQTINVVSAVRMRQELMRRGVARHVPQLGDMAPPSANPPPAGPGQPAPDPHMLRTLARRDNPDRMFRGKDGSVRVNDLGGGSGHSFMAARTPEVSDSLAERMSDIRHKLKELYGVHDAGVLPWEQEQMLSRFGVENAAAAVPVTTPASVAQAVTPPPAAVQAAPPPAASVSTPAAAVPAPVSAPKPVVPPATNEEIAGIVRRLKVISGGAGSPGDRRVAKVLEKNLLDAFKHRESDPDTLEYAISRARKVSDDALGKPMGDKLSHAVSSGDESMSVGEAFSDSRLNSAVDPGVALKGSLDTDASAAAGGVADLRMDPNFRAMSPEGQAKALAQAKAWKNEKAAGLRGKGAGGGPVKKRSMDIVMEWSAKRAGSGEKVLSSGDVAMVQEASVALRELNKKAGRGKGRLAWEKVEEALGKDKAAYLRDRGFFELQPDGSVRRMSKEAEAWLRLEGKAAHVNELGDVPGNVVSAVGKRAGVDPENVAGAAKNAEAVVSGQMPVDLSAEAPPIEAIENAQKAALQAAAGAPPPSAPALPADTMPPAAASLEMPETPSVPRLSAGKPLSTKETIEREKKIRAFVNASIMDWVRTWRKIGIEEGDPNKYVRKVDVMPFFKEDSIYGRFSSTAAFPHMNQYVAPRAVVDEVDEVFKNLSNDSTLQWFFEKVIDPSNKFLKDQALFSIGYHGRNFVCDSWNQMLHGMNPQDFLKYYTMSLHTALRKGLRDKWPWKATSVFGDTITGAGGVKWHTDQLWDVARQSGLFNFGLFNDEYYTKIPFFKWNREVGAALENHRKFAFFLKRVESGDGIAQAVKKTNLAMFDFSDQTNFEKSVMNRFVYFYGWGKKNMVAQLRGLALEPGRYAASGRGIAAMNRAAATESGDEGYVPASGRLMDKSLASRQEVAIPGMFDEATGEQVVSSVGVWGPLMSLEAPFMLAEGAGKTAHSAVGWIGGSDLPSMSGVAGSAGETLVEALKMGLASLNPTWKVPTELAMNYSMFYDDRIESVEGEQDQIWGMEMRKLWAYVLRHIQIMDSLDKWNPYEVFRHEMPGGNRAGTGERGQLGEKARWAGFTGVKLRSVAPSAVEQGSVNKSEREASDIRAKLSRLHRRASQAAGRTLPMDEFLSYPVASGNDRVLKEKIEKFKVKQDVLKKRQSLREALRRKK